MLHKRNKSKHLWWSVDEFRSFSVCGQNPLFSLLVQQQILLYLLSDGSRVNRLCLGGYCLLISLDSVQTSHFTDVTDVLVVLITTVLGRDEPCQFVMFPVRKTIFWSQILIILSF